MTVPPFEPPHRPPPEHPAISAYKNALPAGQVLSYPLDPLDRLDLVGWFFPVPAWISTPPEGQRAFAEDHLIHLPHDLPATPSPPRRPATLPAAATL